MHRPAGFSLIELMITVAIVAILAAVAVPAYTDYVTRAKLSEASANLSDLRVKMEQYYLDNRRYSTNAAGGTCGIPGGNTPTMGNAKYFGYSCASGSANTTGDQAYTLTATGLAAQSVDGIVYTIDQSNSKTTTVSGNMASKGYATNAACWVTKKPSSC
jgi:type IV pilus assembly protein PilE